MGKCCSNTSLTANSELEWYGRYKNRPGKGTNKSEAFRQEQYVLTFFYFPVIFGPFVSFVSSSNHCNQPASLTQFRLKLKKESFTLVKFWSRLLKFISRQKNPKLAPHIDADALQSHCS